MKLLIGNTQVELREDYCADENQKEVQAVPLMRVTRCAALALALVHTKAS